MDSGTSSHRSLTLEISRIHNSALKISLIKFDGTNYLPWSKACMIFVMANKLAGYLTGTTTRPIQADDEEKGLSEDALVMSWLLHSIEPAISPQYMMMESAKDIWDAISRQYSQKNNYAQAYEICKESREMSHGGLSLAAYYSNLSHIWQQLDAYRTHRPFIPTKLVTFQKDIEKERVYDFLAGLNPDYDQVRVQVLGKDPFPTLEEAYNLIQHEERRRNSMIPAVHPERSALAIMPRPPTATCDLKPDHTNKNPVVCDYCGKPRHTRATCWKLHGRPSRGRGGHSTSGRSQAHMTETSASPHHPTTDSVAALSSEQILALQRMLSQQQIPPLLKDLLWGLLMALPILLSQVHI
ncbi:UBN2_3 domain-containing protein [Cephalotus follicularis]|uniref:UBN2_3 domain-containing protein n=1 Tax=Cephalotus follicularis TaxID=3775 RepID=A0A1Q3CU93_CEPFO|nr:UBN2_3 domain-containing protein [Cephalotus follicularis]